VAVVAGGAVVITAGGAVDVDSAAGAIEGAGVAVCAIDAVDAAAASTIATATVDRLVTNGSPGLARIRPDRRRVRPSPKSVIGSIAGTR